MTREEIIRNLKYTMEKHKNDTVNTFDTNILVMCKDILEYLEQEPCDDAISREEVLENAFKIYTHECGLLEVVGVATIEQLPSVKLQEPKTDWIPVTFRPMTDEEKKDCAECTEYDEEDFDTILNCPLPEDGETVLITDRLGNVEVDTFIDDGDGCYFECNCDMEDVKAWMPLPKPYEPQERSE